ncbi:hypothetical protein [Pedobacter antarcticus]|uniref:hypothetical protein n=1 Tax=Pedobacter antarcticus TaxID=34086 RepID=UPI00292FF92B|nr:hypothetical protein [Pedobacter antarcticus]
MMNQEDIFRKIGQILNELTDQYQYLEEHPGDWNGFELDLFQANANFLAEHVQVFQKMNKAKNPPVNKEHSEEKINPEETSTVEIKPVIPVLEKEIFKPDNEPSKFEFILNDKPSSNLFDFEEKPVGEIFDRALSAEEEHIIAQKQKLREKDSLMVEPLTDEDDEIGPEPFLVSDEPETTFTIEEIQSERSTSPEETVIVQPIIQLPVETEVKTDYPVQERSVTTPQTDQDIQASTPASPLPDSVAQHTEPDLPVPVSVQEREKLSTPLSFQQPESVKTDSSEIEPKRAENVDNATPKLTLNDLLSSQNTRNTAGEKKKAVILDLKQAISLNDKMRYIKDLFNGYNLAYSEAIDLLNKMPDLESAHQFLQNNYAVKHNWESKQETADQFYELLQQRFNH